MEGLKAAEELFLKHGGNYYFMAHEGEYELYRSFQVPKDQEREWAEENLRDLLTQLRQADDPYRIRQLASALETVLRDWSPRMLPLVLEGIRNKELVLNSFSKVVISEIVLGIFEDSPPGVIPPSVSVDGKKLAANLLQSVLVNPITIAKPYQDLAYLSDQLADDSARVL